MKKLISTNVTRSSSVTQKSGRITEHCLLERVLAEKLPEPYNTAIRAPGVLRYIKKFDQVNAKARTDAWQRVMHLADHFEQNPIEQNPTGNFADNLLMIMNRRFAEILLTVMNRRRPLAARIKLDFLSYLRLIPDVILANQHQISSKKKCQKVINEWSVCSRNIVIHLMDMRIKQLQDEMIVGQLMVSIKSYDEDLATHSAFSEFSDVEGRVRAYRQAYEVFKKNQAKESEAEESECGIQKAFGELYIRQLRRDAIEGLVTRKELIPAILAPVISSIAAERDNQLARQLNHILRRVQELFIITDRNANVRSKRLTKRQLSIEGLKQSAIAQLQYLMKVNGHKLLVNLQTRPKKQTPKAPQSQAQRRKQIQRQVKLKKAREQERMLQEQASARLALRQRNSVNGKGEGSSRSVDYSESVSFKAMNCVENRGRRNRKPRGRAQRVLLAPGEKIARRREAIMAENVFHRASNLSEYERAWIKARPEGILRIVATKKGRNHVRQEWDTNKVSVPRELKKRLEKEFLKGKIAPAMGGPGTKLFFGGGEIKLLFIKGRVKCHYVTQVEMQGERKVEIRVLTAYEWDRTGSH